MAKIDNNTRFKPDRKESENIEKCLSLFSKLSDLSRNSEVVYSRDGKLYNRGTDGIETQIGSVPPKITAKKRIFTLSPPKKK